MYALLFPADAPVMQIAIISDIHSNLEALTKALELIDKEPVGKIVCLGDIVGYGSQPNECIDLVHRRCDVVLQGNHDAAVGDLSIAESFTANARSAIHWTHAQVTSANREYLSRLPLVNIDSDVFYVHSSPCDPASWRYIFGRFDAMQAFHCFTQDLCFIGHSHVPDIFSSDGKSVQAIGKEGRFIINVGSVGQPRDGNPQLSIGIFDAERRVYRNIRSTYDVELASKKIFAAGLPPALGRRLLHGD
jgi:predicted phosphodiesterase